MNPSLPRAPQIGSRQVVEHIWIWFSDNGNIRKWDSKPFPEGTEYVAALSRTAQAPVDVRKALEVVDQPDYRCPVCDEPFKAGDACATDIELGTCHAACLYGSPTVDLDTGEPVDGPIPTYPYEPDLPDAAVAPVAEGVREANAEGPSEICQIDVESVGDSVVIILQDGETGWPAILDLQCAVELRDKLSIALASSDPTPATEAGSKIWRLPSVETTLAEMLAVATGGDGDDGEWLSEQRATVDLWQASIRAALASSSAQVGAHPLAKFGSDQVAGLGLYRSSSGTWAGEIECHGLDTPERVCFYEQDFYVLSNFSSFTIQWKGARFDTSEAVYHWEKFYDVRPIVAATIRAAPSAHDAFKIAERNKHLRRPDWDDVRVDIMRDILRAKATQHEYVRRKLLATGDRELVENSWRDDFWGWGPNRDGKNMLGKLWMEIRAELRSTAPVSHGGA